MTLINAINDIKQLTKNCPISKESAQQFLDQYSESVQAKLIAAIYTGREHIHDISIDQNKITTSEYTQTRIGKHDFARIIAEKCSSIQTYLEKFLECASSSGFDIDTV